MAIVVILRGSNPLIPFVVVGLVVIALGIIFAYLTIKNPNGKLLSCFGCFGSEYKGTTESVKPQKMTPTLPLDASGIRRESNRNSLPWLPKVAKAFTYEELMQATDGFSPSNRLGEGGFGAVYKGTIAGNMVAVKQLKIGGSQGEREFRAEIDSISRIHHRHLVSLVGHCISDSQRLLVYKYAPNGSIYDALHSPGKPVIGWATRMNIARGTARGLAYLHEDCHPKIIHRDIKGSNILLDFQWEAQVADFGLARLAEDTQTHVTTRVMGTFGYMAPEYAMSGHLTDKSDVYSFGVVLLELITGKKYVYDVAGDKVSLVEWAKPHLKTRNVDALADPKLMNDYDKKQMLKMVEIAANCVRRSAERRPKMAVVLHALDTQQADDVDQAVPPGDSGEYSGGQVFGEAADTAFHRLVYDDHTIDVSSSDSDYGV